MKSRPERLLQRIVRDREAVHHTFVTRITAAWFIRLSRALEDQNFSGLTTRFREYISAHFPSHPQLAKVLQYLARPAVLHSLPMGKDVITTDSRFVINTICGLVFDDKKYFFPSRSPSEQATHLRQLFQELSSIANEPELCPEGVREKLLGAFEGEIIQIGSDSQLLTLPATADIYAADYASITITALIKKLKEDNYPLYFQLMREWCQSKEIPKAFLNIVILAMTGSKKAYTKQLVNMLGNDEDAGLTQYLRVYDETVDALVYFNRPKEDGLWDYVDFLFAQPNSALRTQFCERIATIRTREAAMDFASDLSAYVYVAKVRKTYLSHWRSLLAFSNTPAHHELMANFGQDLLCYERTARSGSFKRTEDFIRREALFYGLLKTYQQDEHVDEITNFFAKMFSSMAIKPFLERLEEPSVKEQIMVTDEWLCLFTATPEQGGIIHSPYSINRILLHALLHDLSEWSLAFKTHLLFVVTQLQCPHLQEGFQEGLQSAFKQSSYPPFLLTILEQMASDAVAEEYRTAARKLVLSVTYNLPSGGVYTKTDASVILSLAHPEFTAAIVFYWRNKWQDSGWVVHFLRYAGFDYLSFSEIAESPAIDMMSAWLKFNMRYVELYDLYYIFIRVPKLRADITSCLSENLKEFVDFGRIDTLKCFASLIPALESRMLETLKENTIEAMHEQDFRFRLKEFESKFKEEWVAPLFPALLEAAKTRFVAWIEKASVSPSYLVDRCIPSLREEVLKYLQKDKKNLEPWITLSVYSGYGPIKLAENFPELIGDIIDTIHSRGQLGFFIKHFNDHSGRSYINMVSARPNLRAEIIGYITEQRLWGSNTDRLLALIDDAKPPEAVSHHDAVDPHCEEREVLASQGDVPTIEGVIHDLSGTIESTEEAPTAGTDVADKIALSEQSIELIKLLRRYTTRIDGLANPREGLKYKTCQSRQEKNRKANYRLASHLITRLENGESYTRVFDNVNMQRRQQSDVSIFSRIRSDELNSVIKIAKKWLKDDAPQTMPVGYKKL